MRIVGGSLGGRKINAPLSKWPTRPTTDMAKEALFNILYNRFDFEEISLLDLFSGTGNLSYEAFSRGCSDITLVERYRPAARFIKESIASYKAEGNIHLVQSDVFKFIKSIDRSFDLILADPPYALDKMAQLPDLILQNDLLNEDGLLVIEHDQTTDFSSHGRFSQQRKYGQSIFSFFE